MQLFSADAMVFSKKIWLFFDPEKVKKRASKVAHNQPNPFFSQSSPNHSPQPRIDFSYYEISGPDICSLICESKYFMYKRIQNKKVFDQKFTLISNDHRIDDCRAVLWLILNFYRNRGITNKLYLCACLAIQCTKI